MRFKQFLKKLGKNLLAAVVGGIIGIIIAISYSIHIWFPANVGEMGLAIIIMLPVMICLFSIVGIFVGGF